MAENSDTAAKTARKRGPGRPFQKGQSGNPGGRPAGLAARVREATRQGEDLLTKAKAWVDSGDPALAKYGHQWLTERGFGKAMQPVGIGGEDGGALAVVVRLEGEQ